MNNTLGGVVVCGALALAVGCSSSNPPKVNCDELAGSGVVTGTCIDIAGGDAATLLTDANTIGSNTTLVLGPGTFAMTGALTIRVDGVHIIGQGMDDTTLDFSGEDDQSNGVDAISDNFLVQDLEVLDSKKDAMRVEDSDGVVFRRIRSTWSTQSSANGSYGIYPVSSQNVLVEDSEAHFASDAGLYVGQCQHAVIRNNLVSGNVAGLEIESTQYAEVYGNTATNNTAGIVTFDLPGNLVIGRDVWIHDNTIVSNNNPNFAPGGVVQQVPSGTGTFAMASRRAKITTNMYGSNNTTDIALISGLALDSTPTDWDLDTSMIIGDWQDLGLPAGSGSGTIENYRSDNIVVAGNTHMDSGTSPDLSDPLMFGVLLELGYDGSAVDPVLYDSIGESMFDSTNAGSNSNDNHMCIGGETDGTFASLDLAAQSASAIVPFFRPPPPFTPFDCTAIEGSDVGSVTLPDTLP